MWQKDKLGELRGEFRDRGGRRFVAAVYRTLGWMEPDRWSYRVWLWGQEPPYSGGAGFRSRDEAREAAEEVLRRAGVEI